MSGRGSGEHRIELAIGGMTCASCAARVEKKLNRLDGVEAAVNYVTATGSVASDPAAVRPEELVAAVEQAGFQTSLPAGAAEERGGAEPEDPARLLRLRLVVSAAFSLPVLALAMVPALQFEHSQWLSLRLRR